MMAENQELQTKCKAMEDELAKYKAAELEISTEDESEMPEEETADAKAKAKGVKPVAKARTGQPSASTRWAQAVDAALAKTGGNKVKAVALANRSNPGLREAYLAEANAR